MDMSPDGEFAKSQRTIRQGDYGIGGAFTPTRPQETESIEMPMPELDVDIDEGFETFEDIREPQPGLEPPSFMSLDRTVQHATRGGTGGTGEQSQYRTPGPLILNRPRPRRPERASALANIGLQRRNASRASPLPSLDAPPAPKKPRREGNVLHSVDQEGVVKEYSIEPVALDWTKHGPRPTPSVPSNESILENSSQVQRTAVAKHWEDSRGKEEDDDRITALDQQIKSRVNIYRWLGEVEEEEHPAFDKTSSEEEEIDDGEVQKQIVDRTFDASRLTGKVFGVHQDDNTKLAGDDTRATAGAAIVPPQVLHDSTNITTMPSKRETADKKLERDAFGQPSNASRREYGEPSQSHGEQSTNNSHPVHRAISEIRDQQTSSGRRAAEYVRSASTTPIVVPSSTYRQPRPTRRYELEAYIPQRLYDVAAGDHRSDNRPANVINPSHASSEPSSVGRLNNTVPPIDTQQSSRAGWMRRLTDRVKSTFRRKLATPSQPLVISQPYNFVRLTGSHTTPLSSDAAVTPIHPPRPLALPVPSSLNSRPYTQTHESQGTSRPKTRGKRKTHNKEVAHHAFLHTVPQTDTTQRSSPSQRRVVEPTTTSSSTPSTILLPIPIPTHTRPASGAAAVHFRHTHRRGTPRERSLSPPQPQARSRPPPPATRYTDSMPMTEETTFVVTRRGSWGRRLRDLGIEDNTVVFG